MYICNKNDIMNLLYLTYEEIKSKMDNLLRERDSIMNDCAKKDLKFDDFMEKARDVSEELYYVTKAIRVVQSPIMEYGKTWKGETITIENFIEKCKNGVYTDDNCEAYYATDNAKSDIRVFPSDFDTDYYRNDFTHIIVF